MSTLIVMVLTGLVFAYFATQNTTGVLVNLAGSIYSLPVYVIVLGSLLVGLLISGFINVVDGLSSMFEIHNRDTKIKQKEHTVDELSRRIRDLEMENAKLKVRNDINYSDSPTKSNKARLFFQKLRGQIPA